MNPRGEFEVETAPSPSSLMLAAGASPADAGLLREREFVATWPTSSRAEQLHHQGMMGGGGVAGGLDEDAIEW